MTKTVTVIGRGSFLSRMLQHHKQAHHWRFIGHEEALAETAWMDKTDILINCAFHPDLRSGPYSPIKDIDFLLAGYTQNRPIHYIMLSSRAVYGPAPDKTLILREDSPAAPDTDYGRNKYMSEQTLAETIPAERLTILRMGNIFGAERGRHTFFGAMLDSLLTDGKLQFDIAPDAQRDFLYAGQWADYMTRIAAHPKAGLYNIGAGFGITTQDLARQIIAIYGQGEIEFTGQSHTGQFILDVTKAREAFQLPAYSRQMLFDDCKRVIEQTVSDAGRVRV